MTPEKPPLEVACALHRRVVALERKAEPLRQERDRAVHAAFAAGVKPPTIARATGLGLPNTRRILKKKV
jgi:hypothetical protein